MNIYHYDYRENQSFFLLLLFLIMFPPHHVSCICIRQYPAAFSMINPTPPYFKNIATNDDNVFKPVIPPKQSKINTSPNCIFPQWDSKLNKWDVID